MKRPLNDRLIRSLSRPHDRPQEIWDQLLPGFGCRVSEQGTVSFFVMRRPSGQKNLVRLTLGRYPVLGLSDAREAARATLLTLQGGVDPRVRKAEAARAEAARQASTFAAVAETFIARHVATKRTASNIVSIIRRELIARWATGGSPTSPVPTSSPWSTTSATAVTPKPPAKHSPTPAACLAGQSAETCSIALPPTTSAPRS